MELFIIDFLIDKTIILHISATKHSKIKEQSNAIRQKKQ